MERRYTSVLTVYSLRPFPSLSFPSFTSHSLRLFISLSLESLICDPSRLVSSSSLLISFPLSPACTCHSTPRQQPCITFQPYLSWNFLKRHSSTFLKRIISWDSSFKCHGHRDLREQSYPAAADYSSIHTTYHLPPRQFF